MKEKTSESSAKKAAVLPAAGIGDALLMMIASARLLDLGYEVTTFHPALIQLQSWFPKHRFASAPSLEQFPGFFSSYDLVIAENDNSQKIRTLIELRAQKKVEYLSIFYPSYELHKHAPLDPLDQVFNSDLPMASNIAEASKNLLLLSYGSKENALLPPEELHHRRFIKQVVIHPTSSTASKNWSRDKFFSLAKQLHKRGYSPLFAVSKTERGAWLDAEAKGFILPLFDSLDQLARCVFESGFMIGNDSLVGHLASNLLVPTLIIADNVKRMNLWRPDWLPGRVVTPPSWIPNCKGLRWREQHWQTWISPSRVLKEFIKLTI